MILFDQYNWCGQLGDLIIIKGDQQPKLLDARIVNNGGAKRGNVKICFEKEAINT